MPRGSGGLWDGVEHGPTPQVLFGTSEDCAVDGYVPWEGVPCGEGFKSGRPHIPHDIQYCGGYGGASGSWCGLRTTGGPTRLGIGGWGEEPDILY